VGESNRNVPFDIKRIYWVYDTPSEVERGNHANRTAQHILVSVKGSVIIYLENKSGEKYEYKLSDPNTGLYVPPLHWRRLRMTPDVVCLSISSTLYEENDYIRDYQEFLNLK
jgi:hypothetical protein